MLPESLKVLDLMFPQIRLGTEGLAAFSSKQRLAIREGRDQNQCQFPEHKNGCKSDCGGRLEVHHIIPQRYAARVGVDPDYPENAITVCKNAHDEIHPDMKTAKKKYGVDKQSYNQAFQAREEALDQRQVYWNTEHDRQLTAQAVKNTQKAKKRGWLFPSRDEK